MTLIAGYDFIVFGERVNFAHAMPRIGRSHSIEHTFRTMSRDRCRTNESPSRARARFTNKLIFNFICMNWKKKWIWTIICYRFNAHSIGWLVRLRTFNDRLNIGTAFPAFVVRARNLFIRIDRTQCDYRLYKMPYLGILGPLIIYSSGLSTAFVAYVRWITSMRDFFSLHSIGIIGVPQTYLSYCVGWNMNINSNQVYRTDELPTCCWWPHIGVTLEFLLANEYEHRSSKKRRSHELNMNTKTNGYFQS